MKIKELMDSLQKDDAGSARPAHDPIVTDNESAEGSDNEKVVYIENSRLEEDGEGLNESQNQQLMATGTQWADSFMGDILVELGRINAKDVESVLEYQREKGLYFGEAAIELKLVEESDILHALSSQFGYTYNKNEHSLSKNLTMAYSPFGEQAEVFRSVRGQLINNWLTHERKTLAVTSPGSGEGRSYVAANLALAFAQQGRSTLLIDADLRSPSQDKIFNITSRVGLSMLLSGRAQMSDLDVLPSQVSSFKFLSVLGCGAVPPNPSELLGNGVLPLILRELEKYFDVIILDSPSGVYHADIIATASVTKSALIVAKSGYTRLDETKRLKQTIADAGAEVIGAVLNQF